MEVYCICLPERKQHAELFFTTVDITPIYSNIETIPHVKQNIVNLKSNNIIEDNYEIKNESYYGKIACSISHINALKLFLESDKNIGLIFEDDNHIPNKEDVDSIKNNIREILDELSTIKDWYFCNLSPCMSNKYNINQLTKHIYLGKIGYCMNAYFVSKSGAEYLINRLPLTNSCHTLDTCLPKYARENKYKILEVHPRVFRQKDDHQNDTKLGNKHSSEKSIPEYNILLTFTNIFLISSILFILIYMIVSIKHPIKYIISFNLIIIILLLYLFINNYVELRLYF